MSAVFSSWDVVLVNDTLATIERQLTQAAEMQLTGALTEEMGSALVRGALALLPHLETPHHIVVLKALKGWRDAELLPAEQYEPLQADVVASSRHAAPGAAAAAAAVQPRAAAATTEAAAAASGKKRAREPGQQSIFGWEGAERQRTLKTELRAQREAAGRDEDYEPETHPVIRFPSENQEGAIAPAATRQCPKCPRTFPTALGLNNHMKWHSDTMKDKLFVPPPPKVLPPVECELRVQGSTVQICFRVCGRTMEEMQAAVTAAKREQVERVARKHAESESRAAAREMAGEEDRGEHRHGSKRRGAYTAKMKLKVRPPFKPTRGLRWWPHMCHSPHAWQVLEVFDEIRDDASISGSKITAFEADVRAKGTPYTTAFKWAKPLERARLSTAASKEHRQSLLRVDKVPNSRRKGKYPDMEKEVYARFKAKRARGRKVSARWVSSTARQVMKELHPEVRFAATASWRRRWSRRYKINPCRRKSNVKNKVFADSEPVLLRYFRGLRRRLQLDVGDEGQELDEGVELEPEDVNPERDDAEQGSGAVGDTLDSEDDEVDEAELFSFELALGDGKRVLPPPPPEQLEFKHEAAKELKEKEILYNWMGFGWCAGRIRRPSGDKNKLVKVDGERRPANFIISYEDGEGPHCLTLGKYGQGPLSEGERWVLIESAVED